MQNQQFLSTPSARRATWLLSIMRRLLKHFYPRPLRGGRPARQTQRKLSGKFLSTPSARRATSHLRQNRCHYRFLSTPSARRATSFRFPQSSHWRISIHALCEEGDLPENPFRSILNDFYPRPLRGGRPRCRQRRSAFLVFLSTPSARRATLGNQRCHMGHEHFYPRPLRGGRQVLPGGTHPGQEFLSTPSARRATSSGKDWYKILDISIHALCEEGDELEYKPGRDFIDFYPRPLRGGRPRKVQRKQRHFHFYPRPLRGGRLEYQDTNSQKEIISIHALCEEGDILCRTSDKTQR